jgi:hypothetical protein
MPELGSDMASHLRMAHVLGVPFLFVGVGLGS